MQSAASELELLEECAREAGTLARELSLKPLEIESKGEAGPVTTITFTEKDGKTLIVMRDLYPSKEALDIAMESGSTGGFEETFDQLEEFLAA